MPEIYEDRQSQNGTSFDWRQLMTEEQYKRGQYYVNEYLLRSAEVRNESTEWDELSELYACNRDPVDASIDPDYPNSFLPIITPTVEGQVASIIESNIEFTHVSDNPVHQAFMPKYDAASEYIRRKNKFMYHFKDYARYYDLYGNCWATISWEKSLVKKKDEPNGFPRIIIPELSHVLVDGRIKDYKDLQYAEYIIHVIGYKSIEWARREYGDELAEALYAGGFPVGETKDVKTDDENSFTLLHVWTRANKEGNLQLVEMDTTGLILRESDPSKPYYKHVNNEYPFFFGRMIPKMGNFYGIGDGKILKPIQETINNLVDELELAARFSAQSKLAIDPKAMAALEQYNSNPADPMIVPDPQQNLMVLQGRGINAIVINMIELLFKYSKIATRYNAEFMSGNQQGSSATATQINAQGIQGEVGIKDKRSDISMAMEWADRYCIKMCLEKWKRPFWANMGSDYVEYVDPAEMLSAPTVIPTTGATLDKYLADIEEGIETEIPEYENVYDSYGNMVKTDIDFSTKVIMEPGIAKGKNDIYNMLLGLSQMQVVGADGVVHSLITPKRLKELIEQTIGLKLNTEREQIDEDTQQFAQQTQNQLNPVGAGGTVQTPTATPSNLMGTVPNVPDGDKRGLIM